MGLLGWITGRDKANALAATVERQRAVVQKLIRGRYDAAQTTDINKRHWAQADGYAADAALSPEVRRKLRNRARLERDNNPYLAGMVQTLASDLVGTGPRLQLVIPGADAATSGIVEEAVYEWGQRIDLARKLRVMKMAKVIDGESVGVMFTNSRLSRRAVQLDVRVVEADQLASPVPSIDPATVDGLELDADGNVARYHLLRHHPGATLVGWSMNGDWYDAEDVLHWMHVVRPGQHRGVGEVVPALEQFAHLRRYTLAVITAAETAADFAAILKTTLPPEGVAAALEAWETMPISRGMATSIPDGWDAVQMKAEHPTSTFGDFEKRMLTAIARSMNLPYIVAAMDSSAASYSSMRGDYLVYRKALGCERSDLERVVLDPLLERWLDEAALVPGMLPDGLPPVAAWTWSWTWDGFEHVDPAKEQSALETALRTHTTTLQREYAKRNLDWRRELTQRAEELAVMQDLGLLVDLSPDATSNETTTVAEDAQAAAGYSPPKGARTEAQRGLEWRRQYGRGGTAVGVARARDIANGRQLSRDTIGRMVNYFARHEGDKRGEGWSPGQDGYPSAGRIAWALWGGDAGRRWAEAILEREDGADASDERDIEAQENPACGTSTTTTMTPKTS